MASFLENIEKYKGTGAYNQSGQTLEQFLDCYDPKKYDNPSSTVDIAVFAYKGDLRHLKILMIKRSNHPSIGWWALPGGFVEMNEDLEVSAARELEEETGLKDIEFIQLGAYGEVDRDPRTRVITTAYVALVKQEEVGIQAGDDAADAAWYDITCNLMKDETDKRYYKLILKCKEKNEILQSDILVTTSGKKYLKHNTSKVINTDKIAADHGSIIIDALFFIQSRLSIK